MRGEKSAVERFTRALWAARAEGSVLSSGPVGRMCRVLALEIAKDVEACEKYNPEMDRRVEWCRAVLREAQMPDVRRQNPRLKVSADLEVTVAFLLGLLEQPRFCGRDLAAGGDQ